jgi:hypothetical protein
VNVDPASGTAQLQLEVYRPALSGSGITVKAVWPQEQVESLAVAIPPAPTATPTSTPTPGSAAGTPSSQPPSPPASPAAQPTYTPAPPTSTPTNTPKPTATATTVPPTGTPIGQKATPTSTGTPGTPTPSPTPDTRPFFASSCLTNSVVSGTGGQTTIYALTKPGATCRATVGYLPNGGPSTADFDGSPQVALADGFAIFPLRVNAQPYQTSGVAIVSCSLNGQTATTSQPFVINPPIPTSTPAATVPST